MDDTSGLQLERARERMPLVVKLVGAGVVVLALLATGMWLLLQQAGSPQGRLAEAQKTAGFPLFYPSQLPAGAVFDTKSLTYDSHVVTFSLTYDGAKRLSVSMQSKEGIDTDSFNPTSEFTAAIGRAYIVDLDDRTTAAVVGEKSWVLFNAPDKISVADLTTIINGLRPVN